MHFLAANRLALAAGSLAIAASAIRSSQRIEGGWLFCSMPMGYCGAVYAAFQTPGFLNMLDASPDALPMVLLTMTSTDLQNQEHAEGMVPGMLHLAHTALSADLATEDGHIAAKRVVELAGVLSRNDAAAKVLQLAGLWKKLLVVAAHACRLLDAVCAQRLQLSVGVTNALGSIVAIALSATQQQLCQCAYEDWRLLIAGSTATAVLSIARDLCNCCCANALLECSGDVADWEWRNHVQAAVGHRFFLPEAAHKLPAAEVAAAFEVVACSARQLSAALEATRTAPNAETAAAALVLALTVVMLLRSHPDEHLPGVLPAAEAVCLDCITAVCRQLAADERLYKIPCAIGMQIVDMHMGNAGDHLEAALLILAAHFARQFDAVLPESRGSGDALAHAGAALERLKGAAAELYELQAAVLCFTWGVVDQ